MSRLNIQKHIKAHVLESIDFEAYEIETPKTEKEIFQKLLSYCKLEYSHEFKRRNETDAVANWLMGLPSLCTVHFAHYDILKFARNVIGMEFKTEKQQDNFISQWFGRCASEILKGVR